LGTAKKVWRFFGKPVTATPFFQMSMAVFTTWTSYLLDVASASSGGAQPLEYGQVAALSDWPLKVLVAFGVFTPVLIATFGGRAAWTAFGGWCAAWAGRGAAPLVRAAA